MSAYSETYNRTCQPLLVMAGQFPVKSSAKSVICIFKNTEYAECDAVLWILLCDIQITSFHHFTFSMDCLECGEFVSLLLYLPFPTHLSFEAAVLLRQFGVYWTIMVTFVCKNQYMLTKVDCL